MLPPLASTALFWSSRPALVTSCLLALPEMLEFTPTSHRPFWPEHRGASGEESPFWASGSGGWRSHGQQRFHGHRHGSRSSQSCRQHPCRSYAKIRVSKPWRAPDGHPRMPTDHNYLLAGGGVRAISHANDVLRRLLRVAGLLRDNNNAAVLGGLDTNRLLLSR